MPAFTAAFILITLGVPALLAPPLARLGRRLPVPVRWAIAALVCIVPMTAPLACDRTRHPGSTLLVAILGAIVALKTIDWLANPRHEDQPWRVRLALTIWPGLQIEDVGVRIDGTDRRISVAARRLRVGVGAVTLGLAMTAAGQWLDLPARRPWLDSSLKALEIYALAGGANDLMVAAFALAGYRVTDGFRYPILARSVLDFWSRYNVWIHRWLEHHVFDPIGRRRRRPVAGILAVFAISGLFHEYLFVVAVPDLIGRQLAFFGLHGLGAIGGAWLGRRYRAIAGRRAPRPLAIAATLGFVLLTAPLFIGCLDRVLDLHRDVGRCVLTVVDRGLGSLTAGTRRLIPSSRWRPYPAPEPSRPDGRPTRARAGR